MGIGGCMLGGYYLYILKHNPYMLYGTKEVLRLGGKIFFGEFKADITCLVLGNYFATLIPLSAAIFLFSASRFKKYTCLLAFFLLSYLLFLTGSRSCWMGAIVSIAVIIILGKKYSKGHSLQFALFISLIIAASLLAISHGVVSEYLLVRIKSLQNASEDVSLVARFKIWAGGLNLLFSNPLGMSFWQFYDLCPNYKTTPHNLFISIGLTNGFIGLFGFIWFIFAWFKKMISFLKFGCSENKIFYIGIIAGMVSFLFNGLFDSYNFCFLNISQMWMIFGAAVWSLRDG
jgi:O-antigen ligase